MMVASTLGATAFQKGLGGMHALTHAAGGLLNTQHGQTVAVVMPRRAGAGTLRPSPWRACYALRERAARIAATLGNYTCRPAGPAASPRPGSSRQESPRPVLGIYACRPAASPQPGPGIYTCRPAAARQSSSLPRYVLEFNRPAVADTFAAVARYLDLRDQSLTGVVDWVLELRERVGIPHSLSALGVSDDDVPTLARMSVADPSAGTNPIPLVAEDVSDLLRTCIAGKM